MHQDISDHKEIARIFSSRSKRAIVQCIANNGIEIDLSDNPELDSALDYCLENIVHDVLVMYEERARELAADLR